MTRTYLSPLCKESEAVLESEKSQPLTDIDKRLAKLQEELLKRTGARADYEDKSPTPIPGRE